MVVNSVRFLFLGAAIIMFTYCSCDKKEVKIPSEKKQNAIKVNATKDDLCRLVIEQKVFKDTALSNETKNVIFTMLSDGSNVQRLVDVDTLMNGHTNCSMANNIQLTSDMQKIIYKIGSVGFNSNVIDNVFIYNLNTGILDSLFSESIVYEKTGYGLFVNNAKYDPRSNSLLVSTNVCFKRFNLRNNSNIDYPFFCRSFSLIGNDQFFYNRRHNDTVQCGIYDMEKKNAHIVKQNDSIKFIDRMSVCTNGEKIIYNTDIDNDSIGKIGDSIYFYDHTFRLVNKSYIQYSELCTYILDPSENWIYYVDSVAIRRVPTKEIENAKCTSYQELIAKSQVIYELPYIIRDEKQKYTCSANILQILPIQSEVK